MDRIHILATGTSRGIGAAIAGALDLPGVRLIGHASRPGTANAIPADLDEAGAAHALWNEAHHLLDGRIDVLINNAGVFEAAPIELPDAEWTAAWHRTMRINLTASAELCRLASSISPRANAADASSTSPAVPPIAAIHRHTGIMPRLRPAWWR